MRERLVGDVEVLVRVPAVGLLGEPHLLLAERRAVRGLGVLLVRRPGRDVRAADDERRLVLDGHGVARGLLDAVEREVLAEVLHVPAVGLVALADVLGERERGVALDRDVVVVVEGDQAAELEVAGERAGLAGDALLHVAVAGDRERVVVDDVVAEAGVEHPLAEREPRAHRDALSERAGRRLDPRRVAVLRVARRRGVELAEALDVVEREPVPGQVQQRVEQHRRVAGAQHEPVAVGPVRMLRRVAHDARVEHVRDRGERHRRPGVARVRLLHGVHRERADRVDAELVELRVGLRRGGGGGHESVAS